MSKVESSVSMSKPLLSGTSGNAEKSPVIPSSKDNLQGKYWKVNYHLKDDESFEYVFKLLKECITPICSNYIFAEEYGEQGVTRHIEGGFITTADRVRRSKIQNIFKFSDCQKSQKRNWNALVKYCSKEGKVKLTTEKIKRPLMLVPKDILRPDQKRIVDLFKNPCPPIWESRGMLYWFWEPEGGWGKSVTCLWMVDHMGAMMVSGANKDILCGVKDCIDKGNMPEIIIFDIPRCNHGHVSYQAIEQIKNGAMFSQKYESNMVRFNTPHVVCFSNEPPDTYELSEDRWIIEKLSKEN